MPGQPSDHVIDLYQRHGLAWDQARRKDLFEKEWLERFCGLMPPSASVLDLGCGGGEPFARHFAALGHAVTGVDASRPLIDLCRARMPSQTWIHADMRQVRTGIAHDGVLAWDSFFHLPAADQKAMFPVFKTHVRPGGALMFTSGPEAGVAIGTLGGEPLFHASLAVDDYRALLASHGFALVDHQVDDPSCGRHTVWLAQAC
jgi:2-polyprenyl-3-methyl-5-hydroxy-6-metoxy-1,4-benzoquinol methylase